MGSVGSHGIRHDHLQLLPIACLLSSRSLLPLLCHFGSWARRNKSQVHVFSLFAFLETAHLVTNSSLPLQKRGTRFFSFHRFMHASYFSCDLVIRAKNIGGDPPLKGQENAAH
jgi:hypothetical protein